MLLHPACLLRCSAMVTGQWPRCCLELITHCCYDAQVTGEAQYVDDLPLPNNALHAAFVLSTRPHAKILSIDSSAAEQVRPGFGPQPCNPSTRLHVPLRIAHPHC